MKKAVVLVSGGIDSSTVLAMVASQHYEIYAISFHYNQKQVIELKKIEQFLKRYKVQEHRVIKADFSMISDSSLTDKDIDVPHYQRASDVGNEIPNTYVPARNTIFLSYALGFAESVGSKDIFLGVHATDHSNYPDCRAEYIKSFENMANLATAIGVSGDKITIHAPLVNMTKSEIIAKGISMNVNYADTISCYDPTYDAKSCGKCLACLVRLEAFEANKMQDPIKYL